MKILVKILKSKYFLVPLVLGIGTFFTVLLGTSSNCYTTKDGDLTSQSIYGTYNGEAQNTNCGFDLSLNYFIGEGTSVFWRGLEWSGPISGNVEVKSNSSLDVNGSASFGGTLTNAGTIKVEEQATPSSLSSLNSNLYNISTPSSAVSGHTSENGTTSTFNLALLNNS